MAVWFVTIIVAFFAIWAVTGATDTLNGTLLALMGLGSGTALGGALVDERRRSQQALTHGDTLAPASVGFFNDLLTDDTGYSLHRVQLAAWTGVLLIVFGASVYSGLPEFDSTLLGLMGISAGTYLGFKLPEKQTPSTAGRTPAATTTASSQQ